MMAHPAGQQVGQGFKASVGMIWKSPLVVRTLLTPKGIKHEKGVHPLLKRVTDNPGQLDARAIGRASTLDNRFKTARSFGIEWLSHRRHRAFSFSTVDTLDNMDDLPGLK
jgi:hypothetical protein